MTRALDAAVAALMRNTAEKTLLKHYQRLATEFTPEDIEAIRQAAVQEVRDAIEQIQQEAQNTDVPEIKAFADETLPKLQSHLQMARQLQASR